MVLQRCHSCIRLRGRRENGHSVTLGRIFVLLASVWRHFSELSEWLTKLADDLLHIEQQFAFGQTGKIDPSVLKLLSLFLAIPLGFRLSVCGCVGFLRRHLLWFGFPAPEASGFVGKVIALAVRTLPISFTAVGARLGVAAFVAFCF